jgi:RNA polymerase sigma-70 factor (ECF subfamily)
VLHDVLAMSRTHAARATRKSRRSDPFAAELERHRALVWNIAYRITGVAADADDVVQDTFHRALTHRPDVTDAKPLRPWLVAVAANRAKDVLRRRKSRAYVGPWLPSPVDDRALVVPDVTDAVADERALDPERRAALKQSASAAYLIALERLTPIRRAVLVLRDVLDCSTEETASALGMTEDAVKQALSRARKTLAADPLATTPLDGVRAEKARAALGVFMGALATGNHAALEKLLADDVRLVSDGGGEFFAARRVVTGKKRAITIYSRLAQLGVVKNFRVVTLNGLAAIVVDVTSHILQQKGVAPRTVISVEVDARGRVVEIRSVLASGKLTALV